MDIDTSEIHDSQVAVNYNFVNPEILNDGGKSLAQSVIAREKEKTRYDRAYNAPDEAFQVDPTEIEFNPMIAEVILSRIAPTYIQTNGITDSQREDSFNNFATFVDSVETVLTQDPLKILKVADYPELISADGVKELIRQQSAVKSMDYNFVRGFDEVCKLLPDDAGRQQFIDTFTVKLLDSSPSTFLECLSVTTLADYIEPTLLQAHIDKALATANLGSTHALKELIAKGMLSPSEVEDQILKNMLVNPEQYLGSIDTFQKAGLFTSEGTLNEFSKRMVEVYKDPELKNISLWPIRNIPVGVLTMEQAVDAVRSRVSLDPMVSISWHASFIAELLPEEEYKPLMDAAIASGAGLESDSFVEYILESNTYDNTGKIAIIDKLVTDQPAFFTKHMDKIWEIVPEESRSSYINGLLNNTQLIGDGIVIKMDLWLPIITTDPSEQKTYLTDLFKKRASVDVVSTFLTDWSDLSDELKSLFTRDEIIGIAFDRLEPTIENINLYVHTLRRSLTDDELRPFVEKIRELDPRAFIMNIDTFSALYTQEEVIDTVRESIKTDTGAVSAMSYLAYWSKKTGIGFAREAVESMIHERPGLMLERLQTINQVLGADYDFMRSLIDTTLKKNPAAGISALEDIAQVLPENISQDDVINFALEDQVTIGRAPKTLKKFYRRIKTTEDENQRAILITEARGVYSLLNILSNVGLIEEYDRLHSSDGFVMNDEQQLLDVFKTVAMLKLGGVDVDTTGASNLSDIKHSLLDAIADQYNLPEGVTTEQANSFFESMGSGNSFFLYAATYSKSPNSELLRDMLQSISSNEYKQWKYGGTEGLVGLQSSGLVPANFTQGQLQAWATNEQSTSTKTIEVTTESISEGVRSIIQSEMAKIGSPLEYLEDRDGQLMNSLSESLSDYGRRISSLHTERKIADSVGDNARLEELSAEIDTIQDSILGLKRDRDIIVLSNLTSEEILSGKILDKKNGKPKESIQKVLERLQEAIPPSAAFITDEITNLFEPVEEAGQLVVYDTDDPKITIEIGSNPVGSCQHYGHGILNHCLVGYTDPNTKVVMIDNNGKHIGRAIMRVLSDEDGGSALHLETTYFSQAGNTINDTVLQHALAKSQKLGIPLYVGRDSYSEVDETRYSITPSGASLFSNGSRANYVYSDAAGGPQSKGKYVIAGLKQVSPVIRQ